MATETHAAEEVSAGMPQLDFSTFPNQIFWLVLTLLAIYFIVKRMAIPRISAVLAERADTITDDIAAAEDLRDRAKAAEAAYDKALADARSEAGRIIAAAKAEMQAELDSELARADAQISARTAQSEKLLASIRDQAVQSIAEVARDTAGEIVRSFGASAEDVAIQAAVAERMKG
jgi:F-type H+-transporting ATPase subunit b